MADIIVTTPKRQSHIAAEEAQRCIQNGGGYYFRTFRNRPRNLGVGTRIFYVEDGYIRGFGTVSEIVEGNKQCTTTGQDWGEGYHAIMPADGWTWIKPIKMKGFQGWRYYETKKIKVVGGWLDPKPEVKRTR